MPAFALIAPCLETTKTITSSQMHSFWKSFRPNPIAWAVWSKNRILCWEHSVFRISGGNCKGNAEQKKNNCWRNWAWSLIDWYNGYRLLERKLKKVFANKLNPSNRLFNNSFRVKKWKETMLLVYGCKKERKLSTVWRKISIQHNFRVVMVIMILSFGFKDSVCSGNKGNQCKKQNMISKGPLKICT